jgi:hypothetical protein
MNERIKELLSEAKIYDGSTTQNITTCPSDLEKFAELIVRECVNREALLGAIARGWCSEKNSHKTMDSDLAVAIFDQVEQQIRQQFGVEE